MNVEFPKTGRYVVAVSGGVDSVVLLDVLSRRPGLELIVAHFDHGIRTDSIEDRKFVEALAKSYGLAFEYAEGKLGQKASEATARDARYEFLKEVLKKYAANAILTAHHQDDVLETAILNMLRGTGRKGLTALQNHDSRLRPLLAVSKAELIDYAKQNKLEWRDDPSNEDINYLRNYVRHKILPRFNDAQRAQFLKTLSSLKVTNQELDNLLQIVVGNGSKLDRRWFGGLSHDVAREVLATWLRQNNVRQFDRKTLERLVVASKTGKPLSRTDVISGVSLRVNKDSLALELPER